MSDIHFILKLLFLSISEIFYTIFYTTMTLLSAMFYLYVYKVILSLLIPCEFGFLICLLDILCQLILSESENTYLTPMLFL